MIKHEHSELIHAWADGAIIQFRFVGEDWTTVKSPYWDAGENGEYRIKHDPKPDLVREALIVNSLSAGPLLYAAAPDEANIVLVFDGETNKLKQCTFKGA